MLTSAEPLPVYTVTNGNDVTYQRPVPYRYPTSVAQIAENNRAAGFHWFAKDTLRFFSSRVSSRLHYNWPAFPRLVWFVSSEAYRNEPRRYTVRVHDVTTGGVDTVGQFQEFDTDKAAHAAAGRAAKEGRRV